MLRFPRPWSFALLCAAGSAAACQLILPFDGYAGGGGAETGSPADAGTARKDATTDAHDASNPRSDARADRQSTPDAAQDAAADSCSSDASCGSCGHSCLGGSCLDGGCQPLTLDPGNAHGAFDLAIDDASVYWTDNVVGSVNYVLKSGASKGSLTGENAPYVTGVTTGAGRVYFASNAGYVGSCPATGCGGGNAQETFITKDGGDLRGVVASGNYLYWADETIDGGLSAVVGGALDGGAFSRLATYPAHQLQQFIAADDASVYWAQDDKLFSCPLAGCAGAVVTVAAGSYPHEIAPSAPSVYFTTVATGASTLQYCGSSSGCASPATLYSSSVDTFGGVAIDAMYVYWTSSPSVDAGASGPGGQILRCPRSATSNCTPTVLAANEYRPDHIAVDDTAVYWAATSLDPSSGTLPIRKLAK